jgi:hypothetical protein
MQTETAQALVRTIAESLQHAIEANTKLIALERTLERDAPNLYRSYLRNLDEVRKNPPVSIAIEGFANLQAKLVQD